MQATVASFDPHTRSGRLLLDDGSELPFSSSAFDRSGLRLLRLGQRVTVETDVSQVTSVRLPGIE